MITLSQIESDLVAAIKSKDRVAVDTLRGLKVRVQNERISKMSASGGKELSEDEIFLLVRSEIKRRKEAAEAFVAGGRPEQAEKELKEAEVLQKYLPAQMTEAEVARVVEEVLAAQEFTAQDFGKAMGMVKARLGQQADGAVIARILKEKLK